MSISIKIKTKSGEFANGACSTIVDYYEIYKNNILTWRSRGVDCFKGGNPEAEFSASEINEVVAILSKKQLQNPLPLGSMSENLIFFSWGFIWQISHKGSRPQVYIPYDANFVYDNSNWGGFVCEFKNVNIKTETKQLDFGDLRDLFGSRTQPKLKLSKGVKTLKVTKNAELVKDCKEVAKIVTTNGGGHHIYVGIC
jgi:hypothetical protein